MQEEPKESFWEATEFHFHLEGNTFVGLHALAQETCKQFFEGEDFSYTMNVQQSPVHKDAKYNAQVTARLKRPKGWGLY